MAGGRTPQQTTMLGAWQDAQAESASALIQLYRSVDVLGIDGPIKNTAQAMLRLVYDSTHEGLGQPWRPEKGWRSILAAPGGPSCKRSKLFELIADLRDAGLLRVVPQVDQFNRAAGDAYQIDWPGVYAVRGLPLPERLARVTPASIQPGRCPVPTQAVDADGSAEGGQPATESPRPANAISPPHGHPVHRVDSLVHRVDCPDNPMGLHARACAPVELICFDDEEKNSIVIKFNSSDPVWEKLPAAADRLVYRIYRHRGSCPSLSQRSTVFLLSVALLAEKLVDRDLWVHDAIDAASEKCANTPPAYLRECIRRSYAASTGDAPDGFEAILGQHRYRINRFLAESKWRADEGYRRACPPSQAALRSAEIAAERRTAAKPDDLLPIQEEWRRLGK